LESSPRKLGQQGRFPPPGPPVTTKRFGLCTCFFSGYAGCGKTLHRAGKQYLRGPSRSAAFTAQL
jgi:hypothetical protein